MDDNDELDGTYEEDVETHIPGNKGKRKESHEAGDSFKAKNKKMSYAWGT